MANLNLYRGGAPKVEFVWDETDWSQFTPPFGTVTYRDTPPFDSHADGAYNLGDFVIGFPLKPNGVGMEWQRRALKHSKLAVGDVLQCIWLPADHMATNLCFKSVDSEDALAGATVALISQTVTRNSDGDFVVADTTDVDDAIAAVGGTNVFALDKPFSQFVPLQKVENGYVMPIYSTPPLPPATSSDAPTYAKIYMFGIKILSLPTDTTVTLDTMRKGVYMSLRMQAFECPTNL